jgi:hypothetical protein
MFGRTTQLRGHKQFFEEHREKALKLIAKYKEMIREWKSI